MAAANNTHSIFSIVLLSSTPESSIEFLQNRHLIRNVENCQKCGHLLVLSPYSDNINIGYVLRCPLKECRARKSLIVDTFFNKLHFPIGKYIVLIYYWASQAPVNITAQHLQLSEKTVIDHFSFIRDICSSKLLNTPICLGGIDRVVQIDESLFVKAKYNNGHALERQNSWVFGIYDVDTKQGFITFVHDRSHETLLPLIRKYVLPGSFIYSDQWGAYNYILNPQFFPCPQPYRHATVNHSQNFVDPLTGVHTNHVEAMWSRCKRKFKQMNGTTEQMIAGYLDEFMWRERYAPNVSRAFDNVLLHISERYPL